MDICCIWNGLLNVIFHIIILALYKLNVQLEVVTAVKWHRDQLPRFRKDAEY